MPLTLRDEQGPMEVDGKLLSLILRETFQMAVAYTVEYEMPGPASPRMVVREVNKILRLTWGDEQWIQRYMHHIFEFARGEQQKKQPESSEKQPTSMLFNLHHERNTTQYDELRETVASKTNIPLLGLLAAVLNVVDTPDFNEKTDWIVLTAQRGNTAGK